MYAGGKKRLGEEGRWETFEQRLGGSGAVSVARKGSNRCRGPEAGVDLWEGAGVEGAGREEAGLGLCICVRGSEL